MLALMLPGVGEAQRKGGRTQDKNQKEKVVVVDDEACGCELVFIDGIQTTERDKLFGFKREDGTVIVDPKYKFVDKFHGNYCVVFHDYGKCGMIDRNGREIVPVEYESVDYPTDGMIRVCKDGLVGFMDTAGNMVIGCHYRTASGFSEGLAAVVVDIDSATMAFGYIDKSEHIVIPAEYEYAMPFQEGYAVVKKYERYGMIDKRGRQVLPCKYLELSSMFEGNFFAIDALSGKAAMFDKRFKRLTDFNYDNVLNYSEGYYVVKRDEGITFLDKKGAEHFGFYEDASGFYEGYSMVKRDGKYGIINSRGKVILPMEYDNNGCMPRAYLFVENIALIEKDGRYGFVDKRGEVVVPVVYESAFYSSEGLMPVKKNGVWGYIDHEGRVVCPFVFEAASYFEWGRAEVVYHGNVFKINSDGQCVKNCKKYPKEVVFNFGDK